MAAKKELLYLILQFMKEEEGLTDAVHALERSSGLFFDAGYFEEVGLRWKLLVCMLTPPCCSNQRLAR